MPKTEKIEKVAELKERIGSSEALLLADYRGLTVSEVSEFREMLREADARFAVVKNTLMKRAAEEAGLEIAGMLEGPTAVTFVDGDAVLAAKKMSEAAKKFPALELKGGYMEGRVLSQEEAGELAKLDTREVMFSKIAGLLQGEMSRAAYMFQALQSQFLALADALKEKLASDEAPAEEAPAEVEVEGQAETAEAAAEGSAETAEPETAEGEAEKPETGETTEEAEGETTSDDEEGKE